MAPTRPADRRCGIFRCMRTTEKAIYVINDDDPTIEHWVPKSQLAEDNEVNDEGDTGQLIVSEWFAAKEGIG